MKKNGRANGKGRFARLPLMVLESQAVTTLAHSAFRVLVLLAAEYKGFNNGAIGITADQAKEAGIGSNHTLYGSLRELELRGLIEQTFPASRVPPRPTMYALSWLPLDDTDYTSGTRQPTHAFRDWKPGRFRA